jgi:hypothetical protein
LCSALSSHIKISESNDRNSYQDLQAAAATIIVDLVKYEDIELPQLDDVKLFSGE